MRKEIQPAGLANSQSTYCYRWRPAREVPFYNERGRSCYNSSSKWYDLGKTSMFNNLHGMVGYSKERKMLDLASSQVFEGLTVEPVADFRR